MYDQVVYLRDQKGVQFNYISETKAEEILTDVNFYYKITCYKYNFVKDSQGKYKNLDFANLYDLSIIDMRVRHVLSKLCLDLEHTLKTQLIKDITESVEDGYNIVNEFDDYTKNRLRERVESRGKTFNESNYKSVQTKILWQIDDHNDYDYQMSRRYYSGREVIGVPIWALIEKMDYGQLIQFIDFYVHFGKQNSAYYQLANELLLMTKRVRNASAHNRPVLMNISNKTHSGSISSLPLIIREKYKELDLFRENSNDYNKHRDLLEYTKIHDIFCIYILYKKYVKSPRLVGARRRELKSVIYRIQLNSQYYENHNKMKQISFLLCSAFSKI